MSLMTLANVWAWAEDCACSLKAVSSACTLCISINRPALYGKHNLFIVFSHCLKWVIVSALMCLWDAILECNSFHSVVYEIPQWKVLQYVTVKTKVSSIHVVVLNVLIPFVLLLCLCVVSYSWTECWKGHWNANAEMEFQVRSSHFRAKTLQREMLNLPVQKYISALGRTNDTPVSQLVRFAQSLVIASIKDQNVKPALGHGSI